MITLKEFVSQCGSMAEAARQLDISYLTLKRWLKGSLPSRAMVKIAAAKGVRLLPLKVPHLVQETKFSD